MAVKALKTGDKIDAILKDFFIYESDMLPHLKQEEDQCLPLLRAYFTPEEVAPKIQEIIGNGPKIEMGSFITCMGIDKFRSEFMPQEGIPGFVYFIDFYFRVQAFNTGFSIPAEALKSGEEPKQSSLCSIL